MQMRRLEIGSRYSFCMKFFGEHSINTLKKQMKDISFQSVVHLMHKSGILEGEQYSQLETSKQGLIKRLESIGQDYEEGELSKSGVLKLNLSNHKIKI